MQRTKNTLLQPQLSYPLHSRTKGGDMAAAACFPNPHQRSQFSTGAACCRLLVLAAIFTRDLTFGALTDIPGDMAPAKWASNIAGNLKTCHGLPMPPNVPNFYVILAEAESRKKERKKMQQHSIVPTTGGLTTPPSSLKFPHPFRG